MSNVKAWAHDKHPMLALFAIMHAELSEKFSPVIRKSKDPRTFASLSQLHHSPLREWLSFYTKRRIYLQTLFDLIGNNLNAENGIINGDNAKDILAKLLASPLTSGEKQEIFCQTLSGDPDFFVTAEAYKDDFLRSVPFMTQVVLPCYFLYFVHPVILLKEARHGNLDSMETLLRLDSSTLFDRRIASHLHDLRYTKPSKFAHLIDCAIKPIKGKQTPQKSKISLACRISILAEELKTPLTEPEIRYFFDALAKDRGQGEIDTDLPESPHSFYMAIKRERRALDSKRNKSHKK